MSEEQINKILRNRVDFKTPVSLLAEAKKEFKTDLEQLRKHATLEIKNSEFLEKSFDLSSWYSAFLIKYELKQQAETEKESENTVVTKKTVLGEPEYKNG